MRRGRLTRSEQRRPSTEPSTIDDRGTTSEPAVAEYGRYKRRFKQSPCDVSHAQSDTTDLRRTRRPAISTQVDQRAQSTTHSRQQQSHKAPPLIERQDTDDTSQLDHWRDSRHDDDDDRLGYNISTTAQSVSLGDSWSTSRPHEQQRQPITDQPQNIPRRLVFRFVLSSAPMYSVDKLSFAVASSQAPVDCVELMTEFQY